MNLFTALCAQIENRLQAASTGLPVRYLGPDETAESIPLDKKKAALAFSLLDDDGQVVDAALPLALSAEVESIDLSLRVLLVVAAERAGLSAGEILFSIEDGLAGEKAQPLSLGEHWSVGLTLEKIVHTGFLPKLQIDLFAARFLLVLLKKEPA